MAVFSAIGAAVTAISGWTIGVGSFTFAAGNFLLRAAVSLGVSALSRAFAGDPVAEQFSIRGSVRTGGTVPRSFVVGPALTAGSLAWHSEWGEVDDTPNAFYTQVIALSDLPVAGFKRWFINGRAVTLAAEAGEYGFAAEEYTEEGVEHAWIRFHDGNQTTADPFLTGAVSAGAPREYSAARIGTGVAYAVVTFRVNQEFFPSFPASKFVLDGVKFYDVSRDETAGGVGSHRWDDRTTWGGDGDALPAVQAYNLARGIYYGRSFLGGGATASGDVVLEGDLSALSLKIVGGGGGTDVAGGDTTVILRDGGTVVQTWVAAGGLATSAARYTDEASAAGGVSGLSPRGNGAAGVVEIFEGGSEGLGLIQEGIAGGTAGEFIEITALDISGLAAPSLEVVVGEGGAGAYAGFVGYNADVASASVQQQWFYGLQGLTAARLPAAHWISQIEKCRSTIAGENGNEPLYRSAGEITVDSEIGAAFDAILTTCAGRMSEVGGVFKIYVGAPDEPVASFTDEDIVSLAPQTFTPFFGLSNTVNGVIATYPSPDEGYVMRSTPPLYNPEYEVQDGNRRLPVSVALDFVPFPAQAQRLLAGELAAARRARRHTHTLPARYRKLEPGDVVAWESVRNGYEGKWFRVDGVIDLPNCDLIVDLTEVDPTDHGNWQHSTDYTPQGGAPVLPVRPLAQQIAGWSVEAAKIPGGEGVSPLPAILVRWNGARADVVAVRVQVRLFGDDFLIFDGRFEDVRAAMGLVSQSLVGATEYEVRGKYVPGTPRQTEWTDWLFVKTDDLGVGSPSYWDGLDRRAQADFDLSREIRDRALNEGAAVTLDNVSKVLLEKARVNGEIKRVEDSFGLEIGGVAAEITTIKEVAISDAAALAQLTTDVDAAFDMAVADISEIQTAVASADQALADLEVDLTASIGVVSADLTTLSAAHASLDSSFSSFSTQLASDYDDLSGYVLSEVYTKSETDSQISSQISTVNSTIGDLSSSVDVVSTAQDGILAQHSVTVNANGAVSGIALLSGSGGTVFQVDANSFRVGKSSVDGGFLSPFQVINGVLYARNAVVTTAVIEDANVTTLKIAGNSVTAPVEVVGGNAVGAGDFYSACSAGVVIKAGEVADIVISWRFQQGYASYPGPTWGYRLRTGVTVHDQRDGMTAANDYPSGQFTLKNQSGYVGVVLDWKGSSNQISRIPRMELRVVYR